MNDSILHDNLEFLQYADDMTLLLEKKTDLSRALKEIGGFAKISGLNLNKQKSVGLWVGKSKYKTEGGEGIAWAKARENIKVLGVYFNSKLEASKIQQNWTEQINAIKLSAQRRNLSLYGKVIIGKTFLLSKINYVIQALTLPKEVLAQKDSVKFLFLWKKKHTNKKSV